MREEAPELRSLIGSRSKAKLNDWFPGEMAGKGLRPSGEGQSLIAYPDHLGASQPCPDKSRRATRVGEGFLLFG